MADKRDTIEKQMAVAREVMERRKEALSTLAQMEIAEQIMCEIARFFGSCPISPFEERTPSTG